ncbi:MAG: TetR/AcrR family transcriptional regulator [Nevskia sp.]|nr:TetR/AcrR family transcriptional regulator [Nevskia sp.]
MINLAAPEPSGAKAERSRSTILAAAEELFATRGYAAARLEDVADAVGLTRAALFYYFRDKQSLYDAMLKNAFASLTTQLKDVLAGKGTIAQRIELAVEAWVDAIVARPSLARLILRYVADAKEQPPQHMLPDNILLNFWSLFEQGRRSGELRPVSDDPFHVASAIIGTTVFYVSGLATLIPQGEFEPLDPKQVAAHKREAVFAARHLLGIPHGRQAVSKK